MITGPTMFSPNGMMRGAPASAHSSSKMCCCTAFHSQPPYSCGQPGAIQPCLVEDLLPAHLILLAQALVLQHLAADLWGQALAQEGAHLFAESLLFRGVVQIHRVAHSGMRRALRRR